MAPLPPIDRLRRWLRYLLCLVSGRSGGRLEYVMAPAGPRLTGPWLEFRVPADRVDRAEARSWAAGQTLDELCVTGIDAAGKMTWRVGAAGTLARDVEVPWFVAADELPEEDDPARWEAALLVAAAEEVDAVVHLESLPAAATAIPGDREVVRIGGELMPHALLRSEAWRASYTGRWDLEPLGARRLVKLIPRGGVGPWFESSETHGWRRRGAYWSSRPLGPTLRVGLQDVSLRLVAARRTGEREPLLVLTSFLATGGAEHTLFETLRVLRDRFDLAIVTLAPHRAERGDRRADFRRITDRIYPLGDLVHPAAMPGILLHLIDRFGVRRLYNANGTTLFYEFAPQLKAARPDLRIVDHLYDHRVGYIDRYDRKLAESVDACVAENHRIAEVLVEERCWEPDRVPVIWPCGRALQDLPEETERAQIRQRMRRFFGAADEDLVFLTAARLHSQKRPLDLVELAMRLGRDSGVRFVLVGGGDLEEEVDAAVAASGEAPIVRLPFRSDIPELILGADVGCLVSEYEGLPVFMIECLQLGRPFLGTAVGEMGRVLEETGAGIVVGRPGDVAGLEEAVRRLGDPGVREELAARAREASARFDVSACAESYARAFLGSD